MTLIQKLAIWAVPVLFAITLHEVAHGWVASKFGDQTARLSGRLTLNPAKHIDLVGTIILPIFMLLTTNFVLGWAKPVPVNPRNLHNPRWNGVLVSLAGPVANLLMALFWAAFAKVGMLTESAWFSVSAVYMGEAGMMVNALLAVLNLLPLPPLDGGRITECLLPGRLSWYYSRLEPYGLVILLLLLLTNLLSYILTPPVYVLLGWLEAIFRL